MYLSLWAYDDKFGGGGGEEVLRAELVYMHISSQNAKKC